MNIEFRPTWVSRGCKVDGQVTYLILVQLIFQTVERVPLKTAEGVRDRLTFPRHVHLSMFHDGDRNLLLGLVSVSFDLQMEALRGHGLGLRQCLVYALGFWERVELRQVYMWCRMNQATGSGANSP